MRSWTITSSSTEERDHGVDSSVVELLNNKVSGRQTNPRDQKLYYPTDLSMDRVPALAKSNFNFGAPG